MEGLGETEGVIEIMEGIDGCRLLPPPGECYFWHKKLSECFMEQRSDGKHIIFHHVPWRGRKKKWMIEKFVRRLSKKAIAN